MGVSKEVHKFSKAKDKTILYPISILMDGDIVPYNITDSQEQLHLSPEIDWISLLSSSSSSSSSSSFNLNSQIKLITPSEKKPVIERNGGEKLDEGRNKGSVSRANKAVTPRIAFHTRSVDDILDDGFRWRKYGQKAVKNSSFQRSYYKCTYHTCNVKKQIQRLSRDPGIVVTTYEGIHNHPCEKLMELLTPLLRQMHFQSVHEWKFATRRRRH